MRDERLNRLANMLLTYSLKLNKGDLFQINAAIPAKPLIKALMTEGIKIGAVPLIKLSDEELSRISYDFIDINKPEEAESVFKKQIEWEKAYWEHVAAHVDIGVSENDMEMSPVDPKKLQLRGRAMRELFDIMIDQRKWVYLHWPTKGQAQKAGMSYDDFFEFFINVCLVDYEKMSRDLVPLRELMEKTDRVQILGNGSDLSFSIKGLPVVPCSGEANIPDGEIFTAPVRESINGTLQYNTTTNYQGKQYINPRFVFKNGKIVEASCENDARGINDVLDTDEGARYIGEFALGVNNRIKKAFGNTLYDEKIGGSFHITPGNAYEDAFNGNKSAIHWDIVCIQTPEFGGGEILFDGALIRKNGNFIPEALRGLNP
jgi:aminopeptidase